MNRDSLEQIFNDNIRVINSHSPVCSELNLPLISQQLTVEQLMSIDTDVFLEYFVERYNTSLNPTVFLIAVKTKWSTIHPLFEQLDSNPPPIVPFQESIHDISNNLPIKYIHFSAKYYVAHKTLGSIYTINPNVSKFIVSNKNPSIQLQ